MALGVVGTPSLFDRLDSGEIVVAGENQDGRDLLAEGGGSGFSTYTQTLTGVDLADPAVATAAATAVRDLTAIEHVESAVNPFVVPEGPTSPQALRFVLDGDPASGGFATVVTFDADNTAEEEATATEQVDVVLDRLAADTGATGDQRGGLRPLVDRIIEQVKIDGQRGEGIALPVSFLVMVVVFGGFLAAGFPVLGAVASIAGALASLLGLSYVLDLDASVVNVVTVLGAGPVHRLRAARRLPLPRGDARAAPGGSGRRHHPRAGRVGHRRRRWTAPGAPSSSPPSPSRSRSRACSCWRSRSSAP